MHRLDRALRAIPLLTGALALAIVAIVFIVDAFPARFPPRAHDVLGALVLVLIALAYVARHVARRSALLELAKAFVLVAGLLSWGAHQACPDIVVATLFGDVAVALLVLDAFLVIVGWPARVRPLLNHPGTRRPISR